MATNKLVQDLTRMFAEEDKVRAENRRKLAETRRRDRLLKFFMAVGILAAVGGTFYIWGAVVFRLMRV